MAFVVSKAIGLQAGTAASDYIQLYHGKAEMLAASLNRIQPAAAEIIAALECPIEAARAAWTISLSCGDLRGGAFAIQVLVHPARKWPVPTLHLQAKQQWFGQLSFEWPMRARPDQLSRPRNRLAGSHPPDGRTLRLRLAGIQSENQRQLAPTQIICQPLRAVARWFGNLFSHAINRHRE